MRLHGPTDTLGGGLWLKPQAMKNVLCTVLYLPLGQNTEVWVLEVGDMGPGGPLIFIMIIKGPYFRIGIMNIYLKLAICGDSWAFDHLWYLLTRCLVHFLHLDNTDQRWRKAHESPQIARFW